MLISPDGPGDGGQDLHDPFLLDVADAWRFAKGLG